MSSSSTIGKKIIFNFQRAKDKQRLNDKYGKRGVLMKLITNRSKLNTQIDETLAEHVNKYKLNGPAQNLTTQTTSTQSAYEETKLKIAKLKISKVDKDHQTTAKLRAHHLTDFLSNYLINSFQSGFIGSELNYKYPSFQVSRLLLTADLNKLKIFWLTNVDENINTDIEQNYFPKLTAQIRHEIISNRIIGYVPPVVFIRDNSKMVLDKLEELLRVASIKTDKEDVEVEGNDDEDVGRQQTDTTIVNNVYGVDHVKLMNQIKPAQVSSVLDTDVIEEDVIEKKKFDSTLKAMKINQRIKKEKQTSKSALLQLALYEYENSKIANKVIKNLDDDE
jgi:hypothetical protein